MNSKPIILFDLDGTLIIPRRKAVNSKMIMISLSIQSRQMKKIAISYSVPSIVINPLNRLAHIWNTARKYAELHNFGEIRTTSMMAELNEPFKRQEAVEHSLSVLLPDVVEVLESLIRESFMLGMVTTASRAGFERISGSKKFGNFGRYFLHSITRDECSYIKPDPEPINRILRLFGRSDFLYIGDSDHDADATKAAKGRFILLNTKQYDESTIRVMGPEVTLASLTEIPDTISRIFR